MDKRKRKGVSNHVEVGQYAFLPFDILSMILSMLPFETIVRCRSVCKTWRDIIKTDCFVKLQLTRANGRTPWLILQKLRTPAISLMLLDADQQKVIEVPAFTHRIFSDWSFPSIRCSCDGLICVAQGRRLDPLVLCNPAMLDSIRLPLTQEYVVVDSHQLGLGFDQVSGKYKLVREYRPISSKYSKFETLILGEGSWREVRPAQEVCVSGMAMGAVFWNGSLHWLINDSILAFDLSYEKFYTIPFPSMHQFGDRIELLVLRGSLILVDHNSEFMSIWKVIGGKTDGFHMVILDEYDTHVCWNKRHYYTTMLQPTPNSFLLKMSHALYKPENWFKLFFPDRAEYRDFNIKDLPDGFVAFQYTPSFVSLAAICGSNPSYSSI